MKQILFTRLNTAELLDVPDAALPAGGVRVRTAFSTISCGTERANITGDPNVGTYTSADAPVVFPRTSGYSSTGIVDACGKDSDHVVVADKALGGLLAEDQRFHTVFGVFCDHTARRT